MNYYECICCSFSNISTNKKGSVFSYSNSNIVIKSCSFVSIQSSESPACFYIENSSVIIKQCSFSNCKAKNGNYNYGNAFYIPFSDINIKYVAFELCAPTATNSGDSVAAIRNAKTLISYQYHNSSNCFGSYGAIITCSSSTCDDYLFNKINIIDCIESSSFEGGLITEPINLKYINFINTEQNQLFIIHNQGSNIHCIECVFINPHNTLAYSLSSLELTDCISNVNGFSSLFTYNNDINLESKLNDFAKITMKCPKSKITTIVRNFFSLLYLNIFIIKIK